MNRLICALIFLSFCFGYWVGFRDRPIEQGYTQSDIDGVTKLATMRVNMVQDRAKKIRDIYGLASEDDMRPLFGE